MDREPEGRRVLEKARRLWGRDGEERCKRDLSGLGHFMQPGGQTASSFQIELESASDPRLSPQPPDPSTECRSGLDPRSCL